MLITKNCNCMERRSDPVVEMKIPKKKLKPKESNDSSDDLTESSGGNGLNRAACGTASRTAVLQTVRAAKNCDEATPRDPQWLTRAAKLFRVDEGAFLKCLTEQMRVVKGEVFFSKRDAKQANFARDAIARCPSFCAS